MDKNKFDVTTIGDCSVDYFVVPERFKLEKNKLSFELAQKIPVETLDLFPGGNALNTAVSFRSLGLKTAIVTELGDDPSSQIILNCIKARGISDSFVKIVKGQQTNRSIVIVTRGERTILSYHCDKKYRLPQKFSSSWIYLTSLGSGFGSIYKKLYTYPKARIAYNPGSQQLMHNLSAVRKMISNSHLLFVNFEEAQRILKSKNNNPKKLLKGLASLGVDHMVVTNGPKGAFAYGDGQFFKIGIYPARRVDATGAGDAFASAATAGFVYGKTIAEALRWGSVMAAHEVSEVGVQNGLLKKSQLEKILQRNKNFKARRF